MIDVAMITFVCLGGQECLPSSECFQCKYIKILDHPMPFLQWYKLVNESMMPLTIDGNIDYIAGYKQYLINLKELEHAQEREYRDGEFDDVDTAP